MLYYTEMIWYFLVIKFQDLHEILIRAGYLDKPKNLTWFLTARYIPPSGGRGRKIIFLENTHPWVCNIEINYTQADNYKNYRIKSDLSACTSLALFIVIVKRSKIVLLLSINRQRYYINPDSRSSSEIFPNFFWWRKFPKLVFCLFLIVCFNLTSEH